MLESCSDQYDCDTVIRYLLDRLLHSMRMRLLNFRWRRNSSSHFHLHPLLSYSRLHLALAQPHRCPHLPPR